MENSYIVTFEWSGDYENYSNEKHLIAESKSEVEEWINYFLENRKLNNYSDSCIDYSIVKKDDRIRVKSEIAMLRSCNESLLQTKLNQTLQKIKKKLLNVEEENTKKKASLQREIDILTTQLK